jgi:hypothetical protein
MVGATFIGQPFSFFRGTRRAATLLVPKEIRRMPATASRRSRVARGTVAEEEVVGPLVVEEEPLRGERVITEKNSTAVELIPTGGVVGHRQ